MTMWGDLSCFRVKIKNRRFKVPRQRPLLECEILSSFHCKMTISLFPLGQLVSTMWWSIASSFWPWIILSLSIPLSVSPQPPRLTTALLANLTLKILICDPATIERISKNTRRPRWTLLWWELVIFSDLSWRVRLSQVISVSCCHLPLCHHIILKGDLTQFWYLCVVFRFRRERKKSKKADLNFKIISFITNFRVIIIISPTILFT